MTTRILIAEDETDIRELIRIHLDREHFAVEECADGTSALEKIKKDKFDLLILDWMLPGVSGLELIRHATARRKKENTGPAILMVTAKGANSDIVLGLETGADDYVVKPFELSVLMARVRALLRRAEPTATSQQIEIGGLKVDPDAHEVRCGKEEISLTPYEFKLLLVLARNRGRVLTRDQLIQSVQGDGVAVVERAIDTHVFGLRKKLGACAEILETVRGVGYRVTAKG